MNTNDITFEKADNLLEKRHYKQALEMFLKLDEQNPEYALNIGYIYDKLFNKKKAKYWFELGIKRDNDPSCMSSLAILYREAYNFNKAKKWFMESIKNGNDDAALELAKILLQEANITKAKQYLEMVMNSNSVCEASREEAKKMLCKILKFCKTIGQNNKPNH